jgi:hypothetical protein
MKTTACLEPLESRIAPASVFVNYIDGDNDLVKITASRAGSSAPPLDLSDLTRTASGQLQRLTLNASFALCNIVFTVKKMPGGDGLADVGYIDATGFDLGNVTVKGDLGHITVGNGDPENPALKTLSVHSFGRLGTATQQAAPNLQSVFGGTLLALKVSGDIDGATVIVTSGGNLGSVTIGGSLIGRGSLNSGAISIEGKLGPVVVKGDVLGGTGDYSGVIAALGAVKSLTIGGDVRGGRGDHSGLLYSSYFGGPLGSFGTVKIGGDLRGGSGQDSGSLNANLGPVGKITIAGSLIGGTGSKTGVIAAGSALVGIKIGGSLIGGFVNVPNGALISFTGAIEVGGPIGPVVIRGDIDGGRLQGDGLFSGSGEINAQTIASITVGGSVIAGTNDGGGNLNRAGTIFAEAIGRITIKGSIVGNVTNEALIEVFGKGADEPGFALGGLTVHGRVEHAQIIAEGSTITRPNLKIGPVKVGGDWIESNLASGVMSGNAFYGDSNDTPQAGYISRIASITIGGRILGSAQSLDHFGFVAHEIGAFKVGGASRALTPGVVDMPIELAYATSDVTLREI